MNNIFLLLSTAAVLFLASCSQSPTDSGAKGAKNHAPEFVSTASQLSATVEPGQQYACSVLVSDEDAGDSLSLLVHGTNPGLALGEDGRLSWTPSAADTGVYVISLSVQDREGGADTLSFTLTVRVILVFTGFDFVLKTGDFWDFKYSYSSLSGFGSNSYNTSGGFRVRLGDSLVVDGALLFRVILSGDTGYGKPRWKYLGIKNYQFLGSEDGAVKTVLFDADKGAWPGSGFFTSYSSSKLFEGSAGFISNSFVSGTAIEIGQASSSSRCEYYPGYGTICGGGADQSYSNKEYYKEGVGPYGYYYHYSYTDYYTQTSHTTQIGMVRTSLRGESPDPSIPDPAVIRTVDFLPDGNGYLQFMTSDPQYYGYTWYSVLSATWDSSLNNRSIKAELIRNSGYFQDMGYGIVFGAPDTTLAGAYRRVLITSNGYYAVHAMLPDTFNTIIPWTPSSQLLTGLGSLNTIEVQLPSTSVPIRPGKAYLYFNNNATPADSFSTNISANHNYYSGFIGYVGSASDEKLPDYPVDLRFKMLEPVTVP